MTTRLPVSSLPSFVPRQRVPSSRDLHDGTGQAEFARELQEFDQPVTSRRIRPNRVQPVAAGKVAPGDKEEPGEPGATTLAAAPFVAQPQKTPPITLELPSGTYTKESVITAAAGNPAGAAESAPEACGAFGIPFFNAMIPQSDGAAAFAMGPQPVDSDRLPKQVAAQASADSQAAIAGGLPEMPQPMSEDLTLAVRLNAQDSQTAQAAGTASKTVLVKEPHRVDADEAPPVQPVRDAVFQATPWNRDEISTSATPHASMERPDASTGHLDAVPALAERPAKGVEPLRNLSIQLGQDNQERVELRVSERAGEVRVAVRTADIGLQNGLRQGLPELVHRLEGQGFRTDAWRPSGVVTSTTPLSEASQSSPEFQGGDSQAKQGWSQQERGQHGHNHSHRPQWVEELEGTLTGDGNRTTGAFHGYIR